MKSAHSGCKKRNRGRILIKNEKKNKKKSSHMQWSVHDYDGN